MQDSLLESPPQTDADEKRGVAKTQKQGVARMLIIIGTLPEKENAGIF